MKKKLLFILIVLVTMTACFKKDDMEGINILTTLYPTEYIVDYLYGDNSSIESIYPDGSNPSAIEFNQKQYSDFSKKDLFIYLGKVDQQGSIAVEFKNLNENLLLIDGSMGIDGEYGVEETWLDPSNMLMISSNVRNGLNEYITSAYLNKEINENYERLKLVLSNLDAEFKLAANSADRKTIAVSNSSLAFLEKYGFEVISLDESSVNDKIISDVKALIKSGEIKHIYTLENVKENKTAKDLITSEGIKEITFRSLETIKDEERKTGTDYLTIMNQNLDLLKEGTYND